MTDDPQPQPASQTVIDVLQQELAELEASLAAIQAQQAAREQAAIDELERAREDYRREWIEKDKRQKAIIRRAMADPFWAVDSHYGLYE